MKSCAVGKFELKKFIQELADKDDEALITETDELFIQQLIQKSEGCLKKEAEELPKHYKNNS